MLTASLFSSFAPRKSSCKHDFSLCLASVHRMGARLLQYSERNKNQITLFRSIDMREGDLFFSGLLPFIIFLDVFYFAGFISTVK